MPYRKQITSHSYNTPHTIQEKILEIYKIGIWLGLEIKKKKEETWRFPFHFKENRQSKQKLFSCSSQGNYSKKSSCCKRNKMDSNKDFPRIASLSVKENKAAFNYGSIHCPRRTRNVVQTVKDCCCPYSIKSRKREGQAITRVQPVLSWRKQP